MYDASSEMAKVLARRCLFRGNGSVCCKMIMAKADAPRK
jgi:hypothetical protein